MEDTIEKQLFEISVLKMNIAKTRKRAFEIINEKCKDILTDKEKMHKVYEQTGMSTSELRTIVSEKTVYFADDAIKIVEGNLLSQVEEK